MNKSRNVPNETQSAPNTLTLEFITDLGAQARVTVPEERYLETLRHYGQKGWYSQNPALGPLRLPLANETDFDWRLVGGRLIEIEGEPLVMARGHGWKRRELAPDPKKKMPAAVKYSRGAKVTDPLHLREGDEDGIQYVTLVIFIGNGKKIEAFARPS